MSPLPAFQTMNTGLPFIFQLSECKRHLASRTSSVGVTVLDPYGSEVKNFTRPLKFLETVQVLLNAKAEVNVKDENCCTAVHRAKAASHLNSS